LIVCSGPVQRGEGQPGQQQIPRCNERGIMIVALV